MKSVTVNGESLPQEEIRAQAANLRLEREAGGRPLSLEERLELQNEALYLLIDRTLMRQEAQRLGLTAENPEIDAVLSQWAKRFDGVAGCRAGADTPESREDIARRILIDKLLLHWRAAARRPRQAELLDYYKQHQQQFHEPEMLHASHIVRTVRTEVETLRARVTAGEDFAHLAAQHSDCPENNGDLGWFARGLMVEEFDNAVFIAPAQTLTPIFQTVFGYHFARVHARKPAGLRPFNEVRALLEESLWLAKQDQQVGLALADLQAKAIIRSNA
jgi:peptidyl-prolyl cis-trans isomerase C/foldase protein PrsA